jgi:hypothetical protein
MARGQSSDRDAAGAEVRQAASRVSLYNHPHVTCIMANLMVWFTNSQDTEL